MSATSVELIVFLVVFSTANELNYRFKPDQASYGDAGIASLLTWFFTLALAAAVGGALLWAGYRTREISLGTFMIYRLP